MYAPAVTAKPVEPDAEEKKKFGFFAVRGKPIPPKDIEIWPENWSAWALFLDIGRQWRRAGMDGGAYALDYNVLFTRMDHLGLTGSAREAMFQDIQHIESVALRVMLKSSSS